MSPDPAPFDQLAPDLRRVTAPNPGPMTHTGTQTYLLGRRAVAVIDPGPDRPGHLEAILAAVPPGGRIACILVTHAHLDHSAGAPALARQTGAPMLAFGPARAGRSPGMEALARRLPLGGGEGVDAGFVPDERLAHGARIAAGDRVLEVLHTPGHLSSHVSLACPDLGVVFTGDTVMGWSSTLISPPDGDLAAFLASLRLLAGRAERRYLPGHGDAVADGPALIAAQAAHRAQRSAQILAALAHGPAPLDRLTAMVYAGTPAHLHKAASRNLLAHLIYLGEAGQVALPGADLLEGDFVLSGERENLLR